MSELKHPLLPPHPSLSIERTCLILTFTSQMLCKMTHVASANLELLENEDSEKCFLAKHSTNK